VPSLYRAEYHPDGTFARIEKLVPEAPLPIIKRITPKLPPPLTRFIVPYVDTAARAGIRMEGNQRGSFCSYARIVTFSESPAESVWNTVWFSLMVW